MMDAILARSRDAADLPARKRTPRSIASTLGRVLFATVERLIFRRRDAPAEFFRYPLP